MDILSVFGIRGRPKEVHRLSDALRNAGIHPALVPDSVKIAVIKLLRENDGGKIADIDTSCEKAAPMVAYCMLGRNEYADVNDVAAVDEVENRLRLAIDSGDSLDAQLAMLTLLARVTHPDVVDTFDLEID
ncbi:MAG: hypothetical protein VX075_02975 [Pseudomonadota bacterium]|nr:hypothetical protein [Pseudomonadota bacterium]